ncbi:MAG: hypothetical protein WC341_07495 [Bacteroidales bacterium]|jgi:hypothetical protein
MKKTTVLLLTILMIISLTKLFGQECISCVENNTGVSKYANAMGRNNVATGYYSSAMGRYNQAKGNASLSLGFANYSIGEYSTTIGSYLKSVGNNSFVIGSGLENLPLTNNIANSIMFGGVSNLPTLIVTGSSGMGTTGMIGIGNTGFPLYKLHLKADMEELAAMFIEPFRWDDGTSPVGGGGDINGTTAFSNSGAYLLLGNQLHGIGAKRNTGLIFSTESYYVFNDGFLKIGKDARAGSVLVCADTEGTARWTQIETPEPSPWLPSGTSDIYFNKGKVGIGTINNTHYALAVLGSIITEEVMVRHPADWFDHVFSPKYNLMPLNELSMFINQNQHLPDVPSEKEVMENGYGLAEMNGILLKKVEELTLYILEQQKVLEKQQCELNEIKDQLKK